MIKKHLKYNYKKILTIFMILGCILTNAQAVNATTYDTSGKVTQPASSNQRTLWDTIWGGVTGAVGSVADKVVDGVGNVWDSITVKNDPPEQVKQTFIYKLNVEYPKLTQTEVEVLGDDFFYEYDKLYQSYKFHGVLAKIDVNKLEQATREKFKDVLEAARKRENEAIANEEQKLPNKGDLTTEQTEIVNEKLAVVNNVRDFIINIMLGIGVLTTVLALIIQAVRLAAVSGQPMLRAACIHNILMTCVTAFVLGSLAFVVKFLFYIAS